MYTSPNSEPSHHQICPEYLPTCRDHTALRCRMPEQCSSNCYRGWQFHKNRHHCLRHICIPNQLDSGGCKLRRSGSYGTNAWVWSGHSRNRWAIGSSFVGSTRCEREVGQSLCLLASDSDLLYSGTSTASLCNYEKYICSTIQSYCFAVVQMTGMQ
jgi:hypothetical protein